MSDDLFDPVPSQPAADWAPDMFEWHQTGVQLGFCSDVVCNTHEGLPLTDEEGAALDDEGWSDDCQFAVRIWEGA